jgi:hypothetical protein
MTPARQRALTVGLIVVGVLIVAFFGLRTLRAFREFRGHRPPPPFGRGEEQQAQTDVELIRDWMTIPFIAHTYRVPPKVLFEAVGIPHKGNEEKSLTRLNEEYFPAEDGRVLEKIKAAVLENQPPVSPNTPVPSAP